MLHHRPTMRIVGAILLLIGIVAAWNALQPEPRTRSYGGNESYETGRRLGRYSAPVVLMGLGIGLLLRGGGQRSRPAQTRTTPRYAPAAPPPAHPSTVTVGIQCSCGHPYEFEIEPVAGRMPNAVACPVCGVDGTDAANASIAQTLAQRAAAPPWSPPAPAPRRMHPALWIGGAAAALVLLLIGAVVFRSFLRAHRLRQARYSPPPAEFNRPASRPATAPAATGNTPRPPSKPGTQRDAAPVPSDATTIEVFWGSRWYDATILKRDGERAFIHYDGWGSNFDEWVAPDRMRPRR